MSAWDIQDFVGLTEAASVPLVPLCLGDQNKMKLQAGCIRHSSRRHLEGGDPIPARTRDRVVADAWLCLACAKDTKPAFLLSPAQSCIPCEMVTPCGKLLGYTYKAARGESISSALGKERVYLAPGIWDHFSLLEFIHSLTCPAPPC